MVQTNCRRQKVGANPRAVVGLASKSKYKIVLNIMDSGSLYSRWIEANMTAVHLVGYDDTLPNPDW
jgi:hypothetical protein